MPWRLIYAGVALTTAGLLVIELSLTRLFSVIFYYHFAFLAISIALFGLGIGGVLSYAFSARPETVFGRAGWLSLLNAVSVVGAVAVLVLPQREPDPQWLAVTYFVTALPFMFGGATVSLVLSAAIERVDRVYFFDLLGAAAGCLTLAPLLSLMGGPNTTLSAAALFAAAALVWFAAAGAKAARTAAGVATVAVVALLVVNGQMRILDVKYAKGGSVTDDIFVRWNSFSRIGVKWEKGWPNPAIFIDNDANTGVSNAEFGPIPEHVRQELFKQNGPTMVHILRPRAKTMIIGPGGGNEVASALRSGSPDVTGVEINPIIANDIMRGQFAKESRNLYLQPQVRIVVEDGRAFVRRTTDRYQVLQATLVDTWAATAAGAFALSENNLYTVDAFKDYLSVLTPDGVMSFTRWGFEPPRESLRLVALAQQALEDLGEADPAAHFMIVRQGTRQDLEGLGAQDTVLISRKPFTQADIATMRASLGPLEGVYLPDQNLANPFHQLLRGFDRQRFFREYPYDVTPVTDNKPFFFYTVQPRDLGAFLTGSPTPVDYKINRAVPMLFAVLGVSIVATLLLIFLPPLIGGAKLPHGPGMAPFVFYFIAVGAAYILVEVALVQRLVLFLGHPSYALTVVIFTLLLASGIGSYWSRRMLKKVAPVAAAAAILGLTGAVALLLDHGVGWPLWVKVAATMVVIGIPGFVMGMPFPQGLADLEKAYPAAVRWAWSLNAAASVAGSVGAIFCGVYFGLRAALFIGVGFYIGAWLLSRWWRAQLEPLH